MSFIAGILTVLLIANAMLLIFLVLVQLPKKDAGAGVAFGGGAADALFGAGSGNVLTKITKWATGIFFALALLLSYAEGRLHRSNPADFEKKVEQQQSQTPMAPGSAAPIPVTTPVPGTNVSTLPPTTAPATPGTAAPAPANPPAAPTPSK